jgi:probable 2-oxoglutarate dehydrogenase E1 component DHKTD1
MLNSFKNNSILKQNLLKFKSVYNFSTQYKESNLKGYINYFRKNSHKYAKIDPLDFNPRIPKPEFSAETWQLSEIEKIEDYPHDSSTAFTNTLINKNTTVSDLESYLNKLYLSKTGVEFDHINCEEEKKWLYDTYETIMTQDVSDVELVNSFKLLYPADLFEKFLHTKFPTFKRYSGEGANTLVLLLYKIFSECSKKQNDITNAIISMPHRGRLDVLTLIMDYPVANLLHKIQGKRDIPKEIEGIDDVVSHVAVSNQKLYYLEGSMADYKPIQVSMLHNPSHLEAIYPASLGKTYAKNKDGAETLNVVIHGDSAVSGQGVIYETLSFHKSPGYNVGGSLHIVTNNQIGYTTQNNLSRSSRYCTDIFKTYDIPVVHVNADDYESIIKIAKLSVLYKKKFNKNFMIDLVCWRKYGHNEVDEPSFTQPLMYKVIRNKKESVELLKNKLIEKNAMSNEQVKALEEKFNKILADEFEKSKTFELTLDNVRNDKYKGNKSLTHKWKEMNFPQYCKPDNELVTGVSLDIVKSALVSSVTFPSDFKIHSRLNQHFVKTRLSNLDKGIVDWPSAEIAAFGTLLADGYNVRISGQDVTRGTFSQRHIGFFDQETGNVYHPLADKKNFKYVNGRLEACNSALTEMAVMLFEYGYSIESPKNFVMWEAQFGDFVNGAQITQDQFIMSGEKKWMRQSGLTLLLPHGFDGTGPEHSSSKIERFLQMTDSNGINSQFNGELPDNREINFSVVQPTTPANYFHVLRRQMVRQYRRPLIVITPKIGLRHPSYVSKIEEFGTDYKFKPIITHQCDKKNKVIFCTGQVYLEINKQIEVISKSSRDVLLIRVEELAPFPEHEIVKELEGVRKDAQFYWIQEESMNMGAFTYVEPHLRRIMRKVGSKNNVVNYIGREAQCGAIGCGDEHKAEGVKLVNDIKNILA